MNPIINRGRVFNVYTKQSTPLAGKRVSNEELVITELGQIGTQIDGFAHQMYGDSFYNCFKFDEIASRTGYSKLGIENVGTLISRGVLIDIAALKDVNVLDQDYMITKTDLQQALAIQKIVLEPGDAVIINTGWGTAVSGYVDARTIGRLWISLEETGQAERVRGQLLEIARVDR